MEKKNLFWLCTIFLVAVAVIGTLIYTFKDDIEHIVKTGSELIVKTASEPLIVKADPESFIIKTDSFCGDEEYDRRQIVVRDSMAYDSDGHCNTNDRKERQEKLAVKWIRW